ncbi:MAG: putative Ig domain-containing protein [Deltaproteobacteria bacterium]|nr:putative Ig domain-containing protein [Deltaproteobacteria bacterium]
MVRQKTGARGVLISLSWAAVTFLPDANLAFVNRNPRVATSSAGPDGGETSMQSRWTERLRVGAVACVAALAAFASSPARASTAYGDLNNFDVFNDTGSNCHGFEIELEDLHSADLTYTYDYNHYGAPTISEDNTNPLHPKVIVRHAAKYDTATSTFSAYTAMPAAPPAATDGHQCTNPSVNIGCEHFGVGHYGSPTVVRYHWLIEDPASPGTLIRGPAVNVATPSWTYYAVAPNQPVAQVQAVIQAPPPPPAPVYDFGDAVWVKCIVTKSHNNQVVELRDLVSDDPDDPNDKNWTNGEPDEVEVEWRIMQTEFKNPDGANNELAGENEDLPNGDEVITRRYEFYKYSGPLDSETNEAKCDNYPQIADPTDPSYKPECDPATVVVLGDYIGAQMAGFNVEAVLGLIDHIQDGELDQPFTIRTVAVGGNTPYVTTVGPGSLPPGLNIDSATGVLSGTPTAVGEFSFTITATDADAVQVSKAYTVHIVDTAADACPDDPAKTAPGVCGCGLSDVDTDADGTPDCNDQCPADAGKTAPGVCGCGVSDVDTDADGTPDCNDQCPADAGKTVPGVCGCGVSDVDTDADGTPDCNDQCPADAGKTAPGLCGCGVADADANGNGVVDCLEGGADLSLAMKAAPRMVSRKHPMEVRVRVRNKGPESAHSVMTQTACSGVDYRIVEAPEGCEIAAGATPSLTCSKPLLHSGETAEMEFRIVPRAAGTLTCIATASSTTPDPDPTNQSRTVTARVR